MAHECLWYNGEGGKYHLLDFDPDGLTKIELKEEIINHLKRLGLSNDDIIKAAETVYLININNLKRVFKEPHKELRYHITIDKNGRKI